MTSHRMVISQVMFVPICQVAALLDMELHVHDNRHTRRLIDRKNGFAITFYRGSDPFSCSATVAKYDLLAAQIGEVYAEFDGSPTDVLSDTVGELARQKTKVKALSNFELVASGHRPPEIHK